MIGLLEGRTILRIEPSGDLEGEDEIRFITDGDDDIMVYHMQDCCESVSVDQVVGDINDIIGSPVLSASEECDCGEWDESRGWTPESFTFTSHVIATAKGTVTITWLGTSNGYYSESVHVRRTHKAI